jgi:PAS domain S-box-containing protein
VRSNEFSAGLKASRSRVEELRQRVASSALPGDQVTAAALEELQATLEELEVADEELRQQNEELLIVREALEREHQRYLDLFEAAPDGYLVTDPCGIITNANTAIGRLFGLGQKFLVGKPLALFVVKEEVAAFRSQLNRLSQSSSDRTEEFELKMQHRGSVFDAAISIAAVPDVEGKSTALRWLIRDITERKRIDEEIRNANIELERRVSERTRELETANRLKDELLVREQQARTEAETANRCKDDFLATLSHELRTPLNAIVGWSRILKSKPRDENLVDRGIDVIERNAVSQTRIVSDILEMSRIVTGKLRIELKPVRLSQIVEEALDTLRPMADAKSIHLESTLDRSPRPVLGDAVRLQQVVWNLISNAIKFTCTGGRVVVRLEHLDEATLTVTDTGAGINSDLLPHVFDRFRQGDRSRTRNAGGLGLGLSIVRHLVEMHGGRVHATSAGEGEGASFIVTLPWAEQSANTVTDPRGTAHQAASARPLDGLWVVAVDDEADGREMLSASLRNAGAVVTSAGSCAEAIVSLHGPRPEAASVAADRQKTAGSRLGLPDLLVADIVMPGEDGFDLIRKVRALPPDQGGAIAAIALTGSVGDDDQLRVLAEGYQAHLAKPVTPGELVAAAAKVTHR